MDALQAQFEKIRQQLAGLTATQKMLVTALVAIMVMTMLYWGKYAGNPEMVSLLGDQVLTADDIGPIQQQLESSGALYKIDSLKVMVPADRKSEIMASLMFARVLPQDTHSAFETMSKQLNPFSSSSERDAAYTQATAMQLSQLIGRFPGVSSAQVIINDKNVQQIENSIPPSATVIIATKGEVEHGKALVRAAADGVAHAVSGLTPSQISVIIDGTSMRVPDADNDPLGGVDGLMELKEKNEARLEGKIRSEFKWIEGLTVTVTCDVENRTMKSQSDEYEKKGAFVQPQKLVENTEETNNGPAAGREAGVTPNTGGAGSNGAVSIDGGGGSGTSSSSTITKNETSNQVFAPHTYTETTTPAGSNIVKAATVRVPLTYFTKAYKQTHLKDKDPSDADIAAFTTVEMTKIKLGVKAIAGLKSDDDVSVDSYADTSTEPLAMAIAPAVSADALNKVTGHAKEIGVAVLAVISLFMMATMVRKSAPPPLVMPSVGAEGSGATTMARSGLNALSGMEAIAGEVGGGAGALDGMEMDEDAVRTQQMLDQVSTMVKENPDGAAALVKRWLSRA